MKQLILCMLAIVFLATSCKKDSNNTPDENYYFTAKIDGVDYSADVTSASTYVINHHGSLLTISAALPTVTDGVFLANLSGYTGEQSYTVGTGGGTSYARYTTGSVGDGTYSSWKAETPGSTTTGVFVIAKDDGSVVEGTFQFDGYSEEAKTTKKITDGKFRLKKK